MCFFSVRMCWRCGRYRLSGHVLWGELYHRCCSMYAVLNYCRHKSKYRAHYADKMIEDMR